MDDILDKTCYECDWWREEENGLCHEPSIKDYKDSNETACEFFVEYN